MEEDKAGNEETVQEDGNHFMKIKCKFDAEAVDRIARSSEAESVKGQRTICRYHLLVERKDSGAR